MTGPIRVLVVDDSAFARKVVRECLESEPAIVVVGIARDGLDALEKIAVLSPDVVTLDLMMPNLDGLGVLEALRATAGAPRVVVCSTAEADSAMMVEALSLGAVAAVVKPSPLATERVYEVRGALVAAVKVAATARLPVLGPALSSAVELPPRPLRARIVAIGTSTGGPHAITHILGQLPASFPLPIAVVVHMPVGFTEGFAARLHAGCALEVIEASDRAPLRAGRVIIARAGVHLRIAPDGERVLLDPQPADVPHRPSVDVLLGSAAAAFGVATLGVVLTGMGDDGLVGARAVVSRGGRVLTQSAASCVVYGMPRVIAEAGLSAAVVDLDEMARAIALAI